MRSSGPASRAVDLWLGRQRATPRGPRVRHPDRRMGTEGMADRGRPAPWLAEWGLTECQEGEAEAGRYRARRRRCVRDCHAALLFGDITSPGSRGLIRDCRALGKPWVHVQDRGTTPRQVVAFLAEAPHVKVPLVAGNREGRNPGVGEPVERFLSVVFRSLARMQRPRD